MPWVRRKVKINEDGGDQFHVYDAAILRDLAQVSTRWRLHVKQPDETYVDSELRLVTKEEGLVKHDRVQTGGRHIPNLIDLALKLYGVKGIGVPSKVSRVYFDVDDVDTTSFMIRLTPTAYELGTNTFRLPKITRRKRQPAKRKSRRQPQLSNLPPSVQRRQQSRRGYTVLAEKREIRHDEVLEQLRLRLLDKGLPAKGSMRDVDCYTHYQHHDYFFEVKTGRAIENKARDAIGQLLQYKFLYRHRFSDPYLCVVLDKKPKDNLIAFLEFIDVLVCWTTESGLDCPSYCRSALGFLL